MPLHLRALGIFYVLILAPPSFGQLRRDAEARTSASLAEIARQAKRPSQEGLLSQREVYEPERAVRRRNSAKPAAASARVPEHAAAAIPATNIPSFGGFLGLADNFTAIPPDTQGAVGPNHVVTILNTQFLIQSRGGSLQANFPITLNAFWSPLGKFTDSFDPRIFYDKSADRWLACSAVNGEASTSALLIATTQTGDPTGRWNFYKINIGGANQWGDFPSLGFNANWVAVSMNMFQIRGAGDYINTNLYVFSKADLYDSKGTGNHVTFADDEGEFTPVSDSDNSQPNTLYLMQEFASDFASNANTGELRISKVSGIVGAEIFKGGNGGTVTINEGWADTGADADFGPQLGTATKIDTGDSRLVNCMMRAGKIWCAHTIFLPYARPTRAAAQWFQIDPLQNPPSVLQRGRIDDPTSTFHYAYPAIAVNKNGDSVIGYTRFSATDYPTAAFSYRTAGDPPNAMQPEIIVKAGEASYVSRGARSGSNRWGDYSATVVDPVNDLNFWSLQEYAATPPSTRTSAFGTWWAQITAPSTASACSYSLASGKSAFENTGGVGSVTVTTLPGCAWQAASNVGWITIATGSPGAGNGTVQFTVEATPDPGDYRAGTLTIAGQSIPVTQGTSSSGVTTPVFSAQGVANAASMQSGAVAPGEILTIFGANLGPPKLQTASVTNGLVDSTTGGTRMLFDGIAAPMIYAVSGQAAAVAPFAIQGHSTTQVQVEYQGIRSSPVTIPVAAASPAIFTTSQSGKGQGAILNDDGVVNSLATPIATGHTIVIYATGGGVMSPAMADGTLAQSPFAKLALPYSVRIGGLPATVSYAGAAPGIIAGAIQINVIVPSAIVPSATVPVDLTIGGITSPAGVTIAVQ